MWTDRVDFESNLPAKEPFGGVLESDDCANYNPVAGPSLYLPFIQRALPERFEGRIRRQKKSEPSAEDGWSAMNIIGLLENSRNKTREDKHKHLRCVLFGSAQIFGRTY